jgi:CBS domain-containing protein
MTMTVRDVLRHKGTKVHTIAPDATVRTAVERMNQERVGSLVVVGPGVVGIFTERDVLTRVVVAGRSPEETRVGEVMSVRLSCASLDEDVREVVKRMTRERRRHLPVIVDSHLVGLVSIGDLTDWISRYLDEQVTELTEYIAGPAVRRRDEIRVFARSRL